MTYLFGDNQGTFTKPNFVLDVDASKGNFTLTHVKSGILHAVISPKEVTDCKNFSAITDVLLTSCPEHAIVLLAQPSIDAINRIAHPNLNRRFSRKFMPGKF